jgi:2-phospho-L-lactate guanylyltransferase
MAIHTIIGLKRLVHAKQRLMPEVSAEDRRRLMLDMLRSVVTAARAADLGPVALATSEPTAPSLGVALGVAVLSDGDLPWNDGLVHAMRSLTPRPTRVLYLAGDVPLVTAEDLRMFVSTSPSPGVGIARARDAGTNALVIAPADAMGPLFGARRSSEAHLAAAAAAGLPSHLADIPGLGLDVDTVADALDAGLLAATPLSGTGHAAGCASAHAPTHHPGPSNPG